MRLKLLIEKIKGVGLLQLLKILYYRILQILLFTIEKRRKVEVRFEIVPKDGVPQRFSRYYSLLYSDFNKDVANDTLKGQIDLFGKIIEVASNAWLQDPISKQYWNSDVFFAEAKVEEDGLGDVKYVMELNKMYHLVTLAQAYYVTRQDVYVVKIGELLNAWKETVKYERSVVNKSMLDIIYRCYNLIHVILICYDNKYFRDKILPVVLDILTLSERQIRLFSTPRWCKYTTGANHTIGEMAGIITIQQILQYLTNQNYDSYLKKEYKYLYNSLENIITEEGVYLEQSANYAKLVAEFLMILDITVLAIGSEKCKSLYDDNYLKRLLIYVNTLSYNQVLPNFGDNDGAKAATPFYESKDSVSHLNKFLTLRYPGIVTQSSLTCHESGQFIWKSSREDGVYFFTRVGRHSFLPLGSGSHAHNDQLAVWMGNKGRELFIDYGTYLYNSGIDIINNDRVTKNHNTLSVDGIEQAKFAGKWLYGSYPQGEIKKSITYSDGFEFEGECRYDTVVHSRNVSFKDNKMVLTDSVDCPDNSEVSLSFVLAPGLIVYKDGNLIDISNGDDRLATLMIQNGVKTEICKTEYHPSYAESASTLILKLISTIKGSQKIVTIINF